MPAASPAPAPRAPAQARKMPSSACSSSVRSAARSAGGRRSRRGVDRLAQLPAPSPRSGSGRFVAATLGLLGVRVRRYCRSSSKSSRAVATSSSGVTCCRVPDYRYGSIIGSQNWGAVRGIALLHTAASTAAISARPSESPDPQHRPGRERQRDDVSSGRGRSAPDGPWRGRPRPRVALAVEHADRHLVRRPPGAVRRGHGDGDHGPGVCEE